MLDHIFNRSEIGMHDFNAPVEPDEEVVDDGDECLKCGECRVDYLVWIDDETVRCSTCGTEYSPIAQLFIPPIISPEKEE